MRARVPCAQRPLNLSARTVASELGDFFRCGLFHRQIMSVRALVPKLPAVVAFVAGCGILIANYLRRRQARGAVAGARWWSAPGWHVVQWIGMGVATDSSAGAASHHTSLPQSLEFLSPTMLPTSGDVTGSGVEVSAEATRRWQAEERELLDEQFSRNLAYLGEGGQARLTDALVVIVGLGGVGSHAAQLLARTGVGHLRLVDPGRVSESSSLSTSAIATLSDVGTPKVDVVREWARAVVPFCRIDTIKERVDGKNAARLLGLLDDPQDGNPCRRAAMVLACLPPGETKTPTPTSSSPEVGCLAAVVSACVDAGVPCLPVLYADAMVHGLREVAHQRYSSLHDVCGSVQARQLVARLRHDWATAHHNLAPNSPVGGSHGALRAPAMVAPMVSVIHSGEHSSPSTSRIGAPPPPPLLDERPIAPSVRLSAMPALLAGMGDAAASVCLCEIAGVPLVPTPGLFSRANRDDAHRAIVRRERDVFDCTEPPDVWPEDVEYLAMEVWGARCVLSGKCHGGGGPTLTFTRWAAGTMSLVAVDPDSTRTP